MLPAPLRKTLPRSKATARQEYGRKLNVAAQNIWKSSLRYANMEWLNLKFKHNTFAKITHKLQREQASLLFQLRVGHVPLNAHLYRLQKIDSPICSSCWQHSETVAHYILHCTTYREVRRTLIYKAGRDARNIRKLLSTAELLPHLFQYIVSTSRFRLCNRDQETQ